MHFEHSPKVKELMARVAAFMDEYIFPNEARFEAEVAEGDRWQPTRVIDELKAKARAQGLWNLFLPESGHGAGLTNLEYAPLAELMRLPSIGETLANRIIEKRPYARLTDLLEVEGIGPATYRRLKPLLRIGAAESAGPP